MSSYSRIYYLQNQSRLQENQRKYEFEKYNSDTAFKLIKRYSSRIRNHFQSSEHDVQELLGCSPKFFKLYIDFCLKDTKTTGIDMANIHLHHVKPVQTDPTNLDLWHFTNILPVLDEDNLKQGETRDKNSEAQHLKRIVRFLRTVTIN
jgi:hypothetical protein